MIRVRPCPDPGCPQLTSGGPCPEHAADRDRKWKAPGSAAAARRRIYSSRRWRGLRRQVLREEPWCRVDGCPNLANEVDHVVPLGVWDGDPYDRANLQALCKRHHSQKTAAEKWGRK